MVHGWMRRDSKRLALRRRVGTHQPFYGTRVGDFMLRQDARGFMLGKYLSYKKNPWKQRRRLGMAVAENTPTASFFNQSKQDTISRVSAVQNSVRGPRWEQWQSGGWNTRSHQQCRLRRDSSNSYGCPTLSHQKNTLQYICCLIITQHVHNSYKTYLYTTQHMK